MKHSGALLLKNVTVFLNQPGFAGFEAHMVAATPLGRAGQPGDIATIVAFLASADAGWMTGSLIDAAGGSR